MFADPPGCLLHRQASFHLDSLPSGVEVGPGQDTDVFVLPPLAVGVPNPMLLGGEFAVAMTPRDETFALLSYLATPEAGVVWSETGQYISPHEGFDSADYARPFDARIDALIQGSEAVRFDGSDLMPPAVGEGTFLEAMLLFIATDRLDEALALAQSGYGE